MTFSPTGALLAVGTGDGSVTFFDGRTGARLSPPIAAPQGGIEHVAFSPDEVLMVSGGRDGTVLLWDVATRQPLGSPLQRPGIDQVRALVFHPTGRTVLIQYSSGHLTELSVDLVHYWQRRACQAAGRDHAPLEWMRYGAGLPLESVCQDLIVPGADWEPRPASLR
jgi:WD40 repeat protein